MGVVYLAAREGDFRQRVALKLVRRAMANPEILRRFTIERQTLAALNHPNIVRLIDGGATEDGLPYLVMDYVEGTPIDAYCDERKLAITAANCSRLRRGAACAPQLVVHCDLKTSNILITRPYALRLRGVGFDRRMGSLKADPANQQARTNVRMRCAATCG